MFVLNSEITIGKFRFSGVNEVEIKRSTHSIVETATIKLPSIARIVSNGKVMPGNIITAKQFNDGDPVTIRLGYNGNLRTEFSGFVARRNLNMPVTIECEGYSWMLRRNSVTAVYKSITVKKLLEAAVSGIDERYKIDVHCDGDFELQNVFFDRLSGFEIISNLSKYTDGSLTCFFIRPDLLWCGTVYSRFAAGADAFNLGLVRYRPGYNILKENDLKPRNEETTPVVVTYSKKKADGSKISKTSGTTGKPGKTHTRILNQVSNAGFLGTLAKEKAYQLSYSGYEGTLNTFLEPFTSPGYTSYITDARHRELDGTYLVESTYVNFGIGGARRIVEIGPMLGFAKK